jgi:hypothetical protein
MDGWMDGWVGGWVGGWANELILMDGWMNECIDEGCNLAAGEHC